MIALITGGRSYSPTPADAWALRIVLRWYGCTALMHGGCRGVDEYCGRVAVRLGLPVMVRPADWSIGRGAGPKRNAAMVAEVAANGGILVAFPGGRGTADCTERAKAAGLRVVRVGPG